jgi:hypothetical protein
VNHVATPYDWMNTFWDLDTNGGYTVADFLDLWVEAGPNGWDTVGGCQTISPLTSTTCATVPNACVYDRLRCGALLVDGGTPTIFDSWTATNGTNR